VAGCTGASPRSCSGTVLVLLLMLLLRAAESVEFLVATTHPNPLASISNVSVSSACRQQEGATHVGVRVGQSGRPTLCPSGGLSGWLSVCPSGGLGGWPAPVCVSVAVVVAVWVASRVVA